MPATPWAIAPRRPWSFVPVVAALAAFPLAACGGYVGHPSVTTAASETNGTVDARYVKGYGDILVTSAGYTLYLLTSDPPGNTSCTGSCAIVWPPLLVRGKLVAGRGVDRKLLSSFERSGSHQVLYNNHALYTYEEDTSPGMVTGEGVATYGGIWWVVSPKGNAVKN